MRPLVVCGALFALLCLVEPAPAQSVTAVDVTGLSDGNYVLTIRAGQATLRPLVLVPIGPLPTPTPGPTPVPTPQPSPTLTERAKAIQAAARLVQGDTDRAGTAQAIALLYRQLADSIKAGKLGSDQAVMASAVKMATDLLLAQRGRPAELGWAPVRDVVSSEWVKVVQQGGTRDSYAALLTECADGIAASTPNDKALDPAIIELIMQIIQIVLKLLIK